MRRGRFTGTRGRRSIILGLPVARSAAATSASSTATATAMDPSLVRAEARQLLVLLQN